jgi:hypothetical protein
MCWPLAIGLSMLLCRTPCCVLWWKFGVCYRYVRKSIGMFTDRSLTSTSVSLSPSFIPDAGTGSAALLYIEFGF